MPRRVFGHKGVVDVCLAGCRETLSPFVNRTEQQAVPREGKRIMTANPDSGATRIDTDAATRSDGAHAGTGDSRRSAAPARWDERGAVALARVGQTSDVEGQL